MANQVLLVKLRDLHEKLASMNVDMKSADQLDDETIDALGQLLSDVNELVDRANHVHDPTNGEVPSEDIFERVMQFESQHPRVAHFLSEVTEVLNLMGI